MNNKNPIEQIVIAGCGFTPLLTALFLKKRWGSLAPRITLLECGENPDPPVISCVSSIRRFHRELGIEERDLVTKTGAGVHLGSLYQFTDSPDFFMCEAPYGVSLHAVRFNHWFLRYLQAGRIASFDDFCINAQLAKIGKFAPTSPNPESVYSQVCFGYKILSERYRHYLAEQLGPRVSVIRDEICEIKTSVEGIEFIHLKSEAVIEGDLFIDCSREHVLKNAIAKPLKSPLAENWHSVETAESKLASVHNTVIFGHAKLTIKTEINGKIYSQEIECPQETSPTWLLDPEPWQKNCLTLGPATSNRPSLLIDSLHLMASSLYRLYSSWPTTKHLSISASIYNENFIDEWNRIADSDSLHTWAAHNKNSSCLTTAAKHRLQIFINDGRVPPYENETMIEDQWAALFFAFGVIPEVADPLTEGVDDAWVVGQLEKLRETFRGAAEHAPG